MDQKSNQTLGNNTHKPFFVFVTVIVVLMIVVTAIYAYTLHIPESKPDAVTPKTPTAAALLGYIANDQSLTSAYPGVKFSTTDNSSTRTYAPFYRYDSSDFYATEKFGTSLNIEAADDSVTLDYPHIAAAVVSSAKNLFAKYDLKEVKAISKYNQPAYANSDIICNITIMPGDDSPLPPYVNCADISSYQSATTKLQPFANAYYAANSDQKPYTTFALSKITKKSGGYSNAIVSMGSMQSFGGAAGLFYAKNGQWTYWRGTQGAIACSYYDTYDLKMAFAGDNCATDQGDTGTVQAPATPQ